jgi:hypothetical protein
VSILPEGESRAVQAHLDAHPEDWDRVRQWVDKVVQDAFDGLVAEGEFVPLGLNEHGRMVYRNSR